jgi:hypothetical protein
VNDRAGTLTYRIFDNSHWSSNGPPVWRFGRDKRACEAAEEANDRRLVLAHWLFAQIDPPELLVLGDRLWACRPGDPCRSPACPCCRRAHGRWFVASGAKALRAIDDGIKVLGVTDARHSEPIGALTPDVFWKTGDNIADILKRCGVTNSIVTVDISANESEDGAFEPHWQPHGWAFAPAAQVNAAEKAIRAAFPRTDTVPRPVNTQNWDGDLAALGYGFTEPVRRVSTTKPAASDGSRAACRDTRVRALRVEQRREFLMKVDRAGFPSLLNLRGFRLTNTSDGPEIRL